MSAGWDCVPLRELCDFHNGLWTGKKGPFETANVIRNTNFTADGRIDLSDVAVLQVEARQIAKRRLLKGDIIIEKSGGGPKQPVGRVVLFELDAENYSFSNFTSAIRVKHPTMLDSTYLHRVLYWWYVSGLTEPLQRRSTGIRNLDFDAYKNLEVPVPPLDEQKRIVALLDQAFAALDRARVNAKVNLADARSLFDSVLRECLDDIAVVEPQTTLAEMCIAIVDCEHKTAPVSETGYPSIRTPNIGKGVLSMEGVYRVSEPTYREWTKRAVPEPGDLIMAREAPAGNVAVIPPGERVCLGQRTLLIKPDSSTTFAPFLAHFLLHPVLQERLLSKSSGATVQHVNMKDIRLLPMPQLPTIQMQRELMGVLDSVRGVADELVQRTAKKIETIAALRQSLLQAAFSGRLT